MPHFLYLIPISLIFGAVGLAVFFWTVRSHQYDDLKGASQRILYDDDKPLPADPDEAPDAASEDGGHKD